MSSATLDFVSKDDLRSLRNYLYGYNMSKNPLHARPRRGR